MRKQERQSGFGTTVILLVVLVVALVAVSGVVLYQHHKSSTKDAAATNSHQTTGQQVGTTGTQPTQTQATTYLTIKEWGVRVPYSGSLKLSYTMSTDSRTATFSSEQLTALSSDCNGRGGSIVRWASTDKVSEGTPDANTPTAEQAFAGKDPSAVPYAHIGNFYFTFAHDQAACGDPTTTAALQSQTNNAVKALVPNLQVAAN